MRYRLRLRLALCAIALVLLVDLLVSAPLFFMMIRTRQETLLKAMFVISAAALTLGIAGALALSSLLGKTINEMAQELAYAAASVSDLRACSHCAKGYKYKQAR